MSKIIHDVVATIGEYQHQGETKKRYQKCGAAFTNDDGQISLKLDAVPVNPDWSGWLNLYPKKEYDAAPQQQRPPAEPARATTAPSDEGEIPF